MDDEKLPHRAFFSDNKSTDIVSKIVFNIFLFVSIVVCISWLNSLRVSFLPPEFTLLASLSLGWKGLVFSDPFTMEFSRLNDFFEFASQAFPAGLFTGASNRGVGTFLDCAPEEIILTPDTLKLLVLQILFEAIVHPSWDKRTHCDVIGKLSELSDDLFQLHTSGHLPKDFYVSGSALTRTVDRLIEPFVLLELDRGTSTRPETLLSYLLWTKRTLSLSQSIDDQNCEDVEGFLTIKHINHLSFESFFLGHHSLIPCLRTLLAALTARPGWGRRLHSELSEHQRSCPHRCRKHATNLTVECFDLETKCLSFAKALCLEALRFTVVGWPLGCLREAFRDGKEFLAGDLVLLNEPAVFHDPAIWFKECQMPATSEPLQHVFAPMDRHGKPNANYLASRVLLSSKVCFLPRAFLFRLLLATAAHLFTQCSFRQAEEGPKEFWDSPLVLPLDSSLMRCATLYQNDLRRT
ncbi:unnamed protein product [Taenia asiatica]|uniref:Hydroperoxide lyase n=1 Tax=Taenia asiatica TaxID=60517 RepID=A0A0R3VUJ8_TAEAS|nr:unnamed protein product [Taenia asiatica]